MSKHIRALVFFLPLAWIAAAWGSDEPGPTGPSPAAQEQTVAASVSPNDLVAEALEKNPAVQAARRQWEAVRHRVPQAKALPDPKIGVGWAGNPQPFSVQTGDPSSSRVISATQDLLFPGKLKLRGEIASKEVEAAQWDYEFVRRRVAADVKATFYDYFYASRAIEITNKNKELLQKLAQIAEVRYKVGKGIQQDVLRAQIEISTLQQRLTVLEQQRRTAQVRLNTLLFRDPEAPIAPPAEVEKSKLSASLEDLYLAAKANDPELRREERTVERNQLAVNLARRGYYPDLSVGYLYQQRPALPDMHGATFTLNIPVFYRSKQREAVREATEQVAAAQHSRNNRETNLYFELKEQYLAAKASEELADLYSQAIVPQSSLALESSMASYQVGSADFLTLITNFISVRDYEVGYYRELANYQIALARMEPRVGMELTK